jgi:hypothetical protein
VRPPACRATCSGTGQCLAGNSTIVESFTGVARPRNGGRRHRRALSRLCSRDDGTQVSRRQQMVKMRHITEIPDLGLAGLPPGLEVMTLADPRGRAADCMSAEARHLVALQRGRLRHTIDFTGYDLEPGTWHPHRLPAASRGLIYPSPTPWMTSSASHRRPPANPTRIPQVRFADRPTHIPLFSRSVVFRPIGNSRASMLALKEPGRDQDPRRGWCPLPCASLADRRSRVGGQ